MTSIALMRRRTLVLAFAVFATTIQSISPGSANTPSISLPANFNASTSFQAVGSTSVTNYTGDVQATISVSTGNIKITTTTGLTAPAGYSSSDWTSDSVRQIAFYGTQSNVNLALGSLQYKASALGTVDTITVATFSAGAAYNPANGHFYEIITHSGNINWEVARCRAKYGDTSTFLGTANSSSSNGNTTRLNDQCSNKTSRRTLGGLNGYLANITSLEEHNFIFGKLNQTGWIGGSDFDTEGRWVWMDGPESGEVFWIQNTSTTRGGTNSIDGQSRFNYWNSNEPNNASSREHFAEFGFGGSGAWNDCQNACGRSRFVIEYGGDGGTLSGASGSISVITAPGAPGTPTATAGALSTALSWTAPTSTGGGSVSGYLVEYRAGAGSWQTASSNTGTTSTSYTVTGLTAGTSYTFRVSAINSAGTGIASLISSSATPTRATPTFASWSNVSKTYGDSYTVVQPTVNDSIGGTFTYTSDSISVISISGTTFAAIGTGSATITATFSPTNSTNYNSATVTQVVTVAKASQSITFGTLTTRVFGSGFFTLPLTDTTTSGLAITFNTTTPSTCSVAGRTVSLLAAGECTITADQSGNDNFLAAPQVTRSFTISKATPSLSSFTVSSKTFGDADFSLTDPSVAGSLSGSFTYSSSNTSVATISGNTVTITGAGSSTITALFTPSDTANYETATITATLSVSQASQASLSITTVSVAYGQSLTLQTSGGSGSGSITFAYVSGECTLSGSTLTPTAVGSCIITATKAADSNYLAQTTSNTTITITSGTPTAEISFTSTTFTFGTINQITVTTSVAGTVRFRANTKVIKSCKATATTLTAPFTATCNYRVSTRRPLTIRAILTPTDSGFTQKTSTSQTFLVGRRVGR